jgi:hypothetical protein
MPKKKKSTVTASFSRPQSVAIVPVVRSISYHRHSNHRLGASKTHAYVVVPYYDPPTDTTVDSALDTTSTSTLPADASVEVPSTSDFQPMDMDLDDTYDSAVHIGDQELGSAASFF